MIVTGSVLTTSALMFSLPDKAQAESAEFYFNRGVDKYQREDLSGAISDLTKAIEYDRYLGKAYFLRGSIKGILRESEGAFDDLNMAVGLEPEDADFIGARGLSRYRLGDLKGACSDWRKASSLGDKLSSEDVKKNC